MRDRDRAASDIAGDLAMMHEPGYGTAGTFRALYIDDVVVVADDVQLTQTEHELLDHGREDCVRANRVAFQYIVGPLFASMVERATGRRVLAFSGEVHLDSRVELAIFRLAPERDGAAACANRRIA